MDRQDYMQQLVHRLTLPVRLADGAGGTSGSGHVEALEQPFLHNAYTQQLHEESGEVGRGLVFWGRCVAQHPQYPCAARPASFAGGRADVLRVHSRPPALTASLLNESPGNVPSRPLFPALEGTDWS